ncbi:MAG: BrnA antitoxin family protein [Castellaniella sp.]
MNKKSLDAERVDAENPEWTEADIKSAVRFDALRTSLQHKLRGQRGPQKAPRKVQTSVRYDADIIEAFKEGGPGWQTRMNDALREWLRGREKV